MIKNINMNKELTFTYNIPLHFRDLNDNLKNTLFKKISDQDFLTLPYEIITIISFNVEEMMVVNHYTVLCTLNITAIVHDCSIGNVMTLKNYSIVGDNVVFHNDPFKRIQIICKKPDAIVNYNEFTVCIEGVKNVSKNILCVGKIIN